MGPAIVRLVDLGFEADFTKSTSFAQSMIESLTARPEGAAPVEVEFIRSRSLEVIVQAMNEPATVLHLMAHGIASVDEVAFVSDDGRTVVDVEVLAEAFADDHRGIDAAVIFADCCEAGRGRFIGAMRNCISRETLFIGATRDVNWHESTLMAAVFYGALFKDRGKGMTPLRRVSAAASRATAAYVRAVDGPCPFVPSVLTPTRWAAEHLG